MASTELFSLLPECFSPPPAGVSTQLFVYSVFGVTNLFKLVLVFDDICSCIFMVFVLVFDGACYFI